MTASRSRPLPVYQYSVQMSLVAALRDRVVPKPAPRWPVPKRGKREIRESRMGSTDFIPRDSTEDQTTLQSSSPLPVS